MPMKSRSRTTTSGTVDDVRVERRLPTHRPPTHPGEMLREEFLGPLGISQSEFARRLGVSFPRLNGIVNGRRAVTTDTALRLARVTGMGASFWLGLQQDWDLWHALRSEEAEAIAELEPLQVRQDDAGDVVARAARRSDVER
jgi:antitoxin HigA-1